MYTLSKDKMSELRAWNIIATIDCKRCNYTYILLIKRKHNLEEHIKHPHSIFSKHIQEFGHNTDLKRVKTKRIRPGQNPQILMKIVAKAYKINNPIRDIQLIIPKKLETYTTIDSNFGSILDRKIWQIRNIVREISAPDDTMLSKSLDRREVKLGNSSRHHL